MIPKLREALNTFKKWRNAAEEGFLTTPKDQRLQSFNKKKGKMAYKQRRPFFFLLIKPQTIWSEHWSGQLHGSAYTPAGTVTCD